MNVNAKKYGITKLLGDLIKNFEMRLSALESKHITILGDFCETKGDDFGDLYFSELLDILCLDPSDCMRSGPSKAFDGHHKHTIIGCAKILLDEWKPVEENAMGSPRVRYIRFYEATLEKSLGLIDQFQTTAMEGVRDRFAGQSPT